MGTATTLVIETVMHVAKFDLIKRRKKSASTRIFMVPLVFYFSVTFRVLKPFFRRLKKGFNTRNGAGKYSLIR